MPKINFPFLGGIGVTVVFLILLAIRLEIFSADKKAERSVAAGSIAERSNESWMNIYQNNKKIGVVHRTFSHRDKGFHFTEKALMQVNMLGVIQSLNVSSEGELNTDMTISSFNFDLTSGIFRFNAHGFMKQNKLVVFTGLPGSQEKTEIPLEKIPHMSGGIYDAAFSSKMEKDTTAGFNIFDPATLAMRQVKVTRNADEIISVMGKRILTQKYCTDFTGFNNCAWLDKDGDTLKETGLFGLSLEKVTRDQAREGTTRNGTIDFTEAASIPVNTSIDKPEKLSSIKFKISGIGGLLFFVNGGRQQLRKEVLSIVKEKSDYLQQKNPVISPELGIHLKATPLIQVNAPEIKAQVDKIVRPDDSPGQKLKKIVSWVYHHVEKKPSLSVPNALEVLRTRTGDCNEHAVLVAALLRCAGIPTQIETGLVYLRGRFYYHAWNTAYIGDWITADAVFNQVPADVTHIRLVRGDAGEQFDLIGVMGKIKLEILEQTN